VIVYISIGNSDDKLSQKEWHEYVNAINGYILFWGEVHGAWFSAPDSPFQNACWCMEFDNEDDMHKAKSQVTMVRKHYRQDSAAWALAETEFI
jgi:hypothetical protein